MPAPVRAAARSIPAWPSDRPLRAWQAEAAEAVFAHDGDCFLASATPAAGKTTFGLHVAHRMLCEGTIGRVVVVAPTTHICRQWAADAARYGIDLEPNRPNSAGPEPRDRHGVAVTYQTVAAGSAPHRRRCADAPTLLIADEPHHMGEQAAWGRQTVAAFADARFRLLLSGTPFRSDNTPIPWVTYDSEGVSQSDYAYGYTDALLDGVCRPVTFHPYEGDMEWVSDGRRRSADFAVVLPAAESARRLRTALDPDGDWITRVLRDADVRLGELRAGSHADAGALVVAIDKDHAEAIAEHLGRVTGARPEVVTSDQADASKRIARFATSGAPWLVSVLMVSEGVDIPRLRVGVYATTARTELFFRQVVGRFIRRTPLPRAQMSHVYMPADPRLKQLAGGIEEERNHALVQGDGGEAPDIDRERSEAGDTFRALYASARPDDAVLQTTQPGEPLQLFADPRPPTPVAAMPVVIPAPAAVVADQVAEAPSPGGGPSRPAGETAHERRERLRESRRELVAARARQTGEPHRAIHARINQATRVRSVAAATSSQLEKGNRLLQREIERKR